MVTAPYSVEGTIRTAGTIRANLTVYLENRTKGWIAYAFTDVLGRYFYDDIQDVDLLADAGDTIRVSTSDSGDYYVEFTVVDEPEEKVIDLDYILHPHPIAPYSIEGTYRKYGELQISKTVTIRNLTKGTLVTCTTDSYGRYFYDDIRDGVLLTDIGDTIFVSTPDGAGSTFTAIETEEKVIDFIDIVMKGGLWKIRISPTATYEENESYTFESNDGILSGVSFTDQVDGMSSFDVSILNNDGNYNDVFAIGNIMEIWMDSELGTLGLTQRLTGTIKTIEQDVSVSDGAGGIENNILILKGFDFMDNFKRITVNEIYRGNRTYDDILTNSNDGLLTKYVPSISSYDITVTNKSISSTETLLFSHVKLFEVITRMVENLGDWVWGITPLLEFYLKPRGVIDNGTKIYEFGATKIELDDGNMANSILVQGGTVLNPQSKVGWIGTASENATNAWRAFDTRT